MARHASRTIAVLALTLLALLPADAAAPRLFIKLERVEVEPYFAGLARVRAWVNPINLDGGLITGIKPEELLIVTGGARHRQVPGIQLYQERDDLTDIVVVVLVHPSFAAALEALEEPLERFISKLPKKTTRVSLVTYGDGVRKQTSLGDPSRAARKWQRITADDIPTPPPLVEALKDAIKIVDARPMRPASSVRRLIVVISDGNDNDIQAPETRDEFRNVWKQARKADVVFHTIAFSFLDNREPFLNLGEISKKTNGTFRWARNRADFEGHLMALDREIRQQLVLTYFLPPDQIEGKNVKIACRSSRCGESLLESNEVRAPSQARCGGETCTGVAACVDDTCLSAAMVGAGGGGGLWIALVALLAAGGGGLVMVRKMKRASAAAELAAAASENDAAAQAQAQAAAAASAAQVHQQLANVPYVGAYAQQAAGYQAAAQQAPAYQPAAQPAGKVAQIMVMNGPRQGQTLPLRHGFTIGRTPGCDLVIDDGMTSGFHAQFHMDTAGGVTVVDLGSTNGTFVNGVRSQSSRLAHGMSVRVGQTELRFLQG